MNDCLDIIKIIFYAENHNSTKLENTVKSESEVCFKIVFYDYIKKCYDIKYNLKNIRSVNLNLSKEKK
jgi:hypothetical protein